jgi:hypothetical protein
MCKEETSIDFAAYLQVVKSRWQAPDCALKAAALLIQSGPGPDAATLCGLHTLSQEGLDCLLLEGQAAVTEMSIEMYAVSWIS